MGYFYAEPSVLRSNAGTLDKCSRSLGAQNDSLISVLHDGFGSGSAYETVMKHLRGISRQLSDGQSMMHSYSTALSLIADEYEKTEKGILGSVAPKNTRTRNIHKNASIRTTSENNEGSSFFSWFKDDALWKLLADLRDLGVISLRFYARLLLAFMSGDEDAYKEAFRELMDELAQEGRADLVALIPRYLSNDGVIAFYEALRTGDANGDPYIEILLEIYGNDITPEEIAAHNANNIDKLPGVYTPGQFIENQNQWGDILYGKDTDYPLVNGLANTSNMANSGCGVIAVANALINLGCDVDYEEMANIISDFENDGMALNGVVGTSPMAIYEYMKNRGYDASYITSTDPSDINSFGNDYDTFIVTGYNNQDDITDCLHTVCITKEPDGRFTIHNSADGVAYTYDTLDEAISYLSRGSQGNAEPIMITGVRN